MRKSAIQIFFCPVKDFCVFIFFRAKVHLRIFLICGILSSGNHISGQYIGGDFSASDEDNVEKQIANMDSDEIIIELEKILKIAIIEGFKPRKIDCLETESLKKQTLEAKEVIKKILDILPDDYVILVIGHADKTGPDTTTARGDKGNDYWSTMRARCVAQYINLKLPDSETKLLVGGHGSTRDKRMVSFKILPMEMGKKLHKKLIKKYKWYKFKWED